MQTVQIIWKRMHPKLTETLNKQDPNIEEPELDQDEDKLPLEEEDLSLETAKFLGIKDDNILDEIKLSDKQLDSLLDILSQYEKVPEVLRNLRNIKVVKYSSELLQNLKLDVKLSNRYLGFIKLIEFDDRVSYDNVLKSKFRKAIYINRGILSDVNNYQVVDDKYLDEFTSMVALRNSRVILGWRDMEVDLYTAKRILSLGVLNLIGALSNAELIFEIRKLVKVSDYEIKIRSEKNRYLMILLEKNLFSFTF